jgi:hypothetical protein
MVWHIIGHLRIDPITVFPSSYSLYLKDSDISSILECWVPLTESAGIGPASACFHNRRSSILVSNNTYTGIDVVAMAMCAKHVGCKTGTRILVLDNVYTGISIATQWICLQTHRLYRKLAKDVNSIRFVILLRRRSTMSNFDFTLHKIPSSS